MSLITQTMKEALAIGNGGHPRSTNAAIESGIVDMSKFHRVTFLCGVGTLGASATVRFTIQQSDEAGGGNATNVSGAICAIIDAANKEATIEVRSNQLTKRYVKCISVPAGDNASIPYIFPIAAVPHYLPQGADGNAVVERVVA
jgi:hypothetical protein